MPHQRNTEGVKAYAKKKSEAAFKRVEDALIEMMHNNLPINFNTVMQKAHVSKGFVYNNKAIRSRIESLRDSQQVEKLKQNKESMTDRSKDTLLAAKNRKIEALEEENLRLKKELEILKGKSK